MPWKMRNAEKFDPKSRQIGLPQKEQPTRGASGFNLFHPKQISNWTLVTLGTSCK